MDSRSTPVTITLHPNLAKNLELTGSGRAPLKKNHQPITSKGAASHAGEAIKTLKSVDEGNERSYESQTSSDLVKKDLFIKSSISKPEFPFHGNQNYVGDQGGKEVQEVSPIYLNPFVEQVGVTSPFFKDFFQVTKNASLINPPGYFENKIKSKIDEIKLPRSEKVLDLLTKAIEISTNKQLKEKNKSHNQVDCLERDGQPFVSVVKDSKYKNKITASFPLKTHKVPEGFENPTGFQPITPKGAASHAGDNLNTNLKSTFGLGQWNSDNQYPYKKEKPSLSDGLMNLSVSVTSLPPQLLLKSSLSITPPFGGGSGTGVILKPPIPPHAKQPLGDRISAIGGKDNFQNTLQGKYNKFHTLPIFSIFIYKEWSHRFSFLEFFIWSARENDLAIPFYTRGGTRHTARISSMNLIRNQIGLEKTPKQFLFAFNDCTRNILWNNPPMGGSRQVEEISKPVPPEPPEGVLGVHETKERLDRGDNKQVNDKEDHEESSSHPLEFRKNIPSLSGIATQISSPYSKKYSKQFVELRDKTVSLVFSLDSNNLTKPSTIPSMEEDSTLAKQKPSSVETNKVVFRQIKKVFGWGSSLSPEKIARKHYVKPVSNAPSGGKTPIRRSLTSFPFGDSTTQDSLKSENLQPLRSSGGQVPKPKGISKKDEKRIGYINKFITPSTLWNEVAPYSPTGSSGSNGGKEATLNIFHNDTITLKSNNSIVSPAVGYTPQYLKSAQSISQVKKQSFFSITRTPRGGIGASDSNSPVPPKGGLRPPTGFSNPIPPLTPLRGVRVIKIEDFKRVMGGRFEKQAGDFENQAWEINKSMDYGMINGVNKGREASLASRTFSQLEPSNKNQKQSTGWQESSLMWGKVDDTQQFPRLAELLHFTGGTALRHLLSRFHLVLLGKFLRHELKNLELKVNFLLSLKMLTYSQGLLLGKLAKRRSKQIRRLKLLELFQCKKSNPEWMILSVLPVLPPDLRPILRVNDDFVVASDLNRLYQTVLRRNNTIHEKLDDPLPCPESGLFRQRSLQKAVDGLLENGKGGGTPLCASKRRPLVSLSHVLKGKKGLFRQHLLGKRVDYSGRSVIVVGPKLNLHECGLPKEMALELFQPFLIHRLKVKGLATSNTAARRMIQQEDPIIWHTVKQLVYEHPVLLNRAPTLHRLGIQAFQPRLVSGRAILLHPLVCNGFNADFDGDQMAVHVPLSFQARAEAWKIMWSKNNLLSPATGQPILVPSQDMVLGCYYLSVVVPRVSKVSLHPEPPKGVKCKSNTSVFDNESDPRHMTNPMTSSALGNEVALFGDNEGKGERKDNEKKESFKLLSDPKGVTTSSLRDTPPWFEISKGNFMGEEQNFFSSQISRVFLALDIPPRGGTSRLGKEVLLPNPYPQRGFSTTKEGDSAPMLNNGNFKKKVYVNCPSGYFKNTFTIQNKTGNRDIKWSTKEIASTVNLKKVFPLKSSLLIHPPGFFKKTQHLGFLTDANLLENMVKLEMSQKISEDKPWTNFSPTSFITKQYGQYGSSKFPQSLTPFGGSNDSAFSRSPFVTKLLAQKKKGVDGNKETIMNSSVLTKIAYWNKKLPQALFVPITPKGAANSNLPPKGIKSSISKADSNLRPPGKFEKQAGEFEKQVGVFKPVGFENPLSMGTKTTLVIKGGSGNQKDSLENIANFSNSAYHLKRGHYFSSLEDSLMAYSQGRLQTHTPFWVRLDSLTANEKKDTEPPLGGAVTKFLLHGETPKGGSLPFLKVTATPSSRKLVSQSRETKGNLLEGLLLQPQYGCSQKLSKVLFQEDQHKIVIEGNDALEAPLELRLGADGNLVKILTTFQHNYSCNATLLDQCKEKSIRYVRTTAGRVVINETLFHS